MCFKSLVDEVQELEALSKDPGAVVHGKRYSYTTHNIPLTVLQIFIFSPFTFNSLKVKNH